MDEKRKGEIAYALLKKRMRDKGLHLNDSLQRELGDMAKKIDCEKQELLIFFEF